MTAAIMQVSDERDEALEEALDFIDRAAQPEKCAQPARQCHRASLASGPTRQMIMVTFADPFVRVYYIRFHVRIGGRARKAER
jgi:hypothetical protein